MNSQSAIPLLWVLGPDPKATENKDAYMASKGSYDYQEQILQQAFFFSSPLSNLGLGLRPKQRNVKWFKISLLICSNP